MTASAIRKTCHVISIPNDVIDSRLQNPIEEPPAGRIVLRLFRIVAVADIRIESPPEAQRPVQTVGPLQEQAEEKRVVNHQLSPVAGLMDNRSGRFRRVDKGLPLQPGEEIPQRPANAWIRPFVDVRYFFHAPSSGSSCRRGLLCEGSKGSGISESRISTIHPCAVIRGIHSSGTRIVRTYRSKATWAMTQ